MKPIPPRGTPWGLVASIFLSLLYGASPIDVIPDLIPIIGWMDDGLVAAMMVGISFIILARRRMTQARRAPQPVMVHVDRAA